MPWFLLMAQPGGSGGSGNPFVSFLPIIALIAIFYFLLIRPQQKRAKQQRTMMEALKTGDSVVTIGGIRGTITAVDKDIIIVRVADNVKITFSKSAVAGVLKE